MSAARVRLAWPCCAGRTPLRPVLPGEPHPGRLPGHSERRSDAGPADAPVAQGIDAVLHVGVDLECRCLLPGQAGEQFTGGLLVP